MPDGIALRVRKVQCQGELLEWCDVHLTYTGRVVARTAARDFVHMWRSRSPESFSAWLVLSRVIPDRREHLINTHSYHAFSSMKNMGPSTRICCEQWLPFPRLCQIGRSMSEVLNL